MPWQFVRYSRRPFQSLFFAMELYYSKSQELYKKIQFQVLDNPATCDQQLWMEEKAISRDCLVMGMAALEAFANNLIRDFIKRNKENLDPGILNKNQKNNPIDRWSLSDKIYFLPTLCNSSMLTPELFFNPLSADFRCFIELIKIRNGIVHGRPEASLMLMTINPNRMHELDDDFSENCWPISKIPRDLTIFNGECAKIAYINMAWVKDSLIKYIEKLDEKYLKEEKINIVSRIIQENEADKSTIKKKWRDYIIG
jgi:hypothetical protein